MLLVCTLYCNTVPLINSINNNNKLINYDTIILLCVQIYVIT